jgi:hypothetical protein
MENLKKSSEEKGGAMTVNHKFRLILSAEPNDEFSISLL